eukprot:2436315-Rhodomonas_salina.1
MEISDCRDTKLCVFNSMLWYPPVIDKVPGTDGERAGTAGFREKCTGIPRGATQILRAGASSWCHGYPIVSTELKERHRE